MDIIKNKDIIPSICEKCHDGEGTLLCKSLLTDLCCETLNFMHSDYMPAGVSIGLHKHEANEEIYYLVSGKGIITCDDKEYEIKAGDISICRIGHSHAFKATDDCILIVIGSKWGEKL